MGHPATPDFFSFIGNQLMGRLWEGWIEIEDRSITAKFHVDGVSGMQFHFAAFLEKKERGRDSGADIAGRTGADRGSASNLGEIVSELGCQSRSSKLDE